MLGRVENASRPPGLPKLRIASTLGSHVDPKSQRCRQQHVCVVIPGSTAPSTSY